MPVSLYPFVIESTSSHKWLLILRDAMPRDGRPRQRVSQACIPCGQRKTKVSYLRVVGSTYLVLANGPL